MAEGDPSPEPPSATENRVRAHQMSNVQGIPPAVSEVPAANEGVPAMFGLSSVKKD